MKSLSGAAFFLHLDFASASYDLAYYFPCIGEAAETIWRERTSHFTRCVFLEARKIQVRPLSVQKVQRTSNEEKDSKETSEYEYLITRERASGEGSDYRVSDSGTRKRHGPRG